jgi:hypothetical protein
MWLGRWRERRLREQAKCLACVQNRDRVMVCEDAQNVVCPGTTPPSSEVMEAQLKMAFRATLLRVELPFDVSAADVSAVLFQQIPELTCKGKPTSCMTAVTRGLLDVQLEPRDNSNFMAVVCYVTKISGVWVQIGEMDAATLVDVNSKMLIVYNSKLVNVDAVDSRDTNGRTRLVTTLRRAGGWRILLPHI